MVLGVNVAAFKDGKVLLIQREDYEVWCLPGGHVDPGESLVQAGLRELREETGMEGRITRLVGMYSRPGWSDGMYHIALFAAEVTGGELRGQPEEVIDLRFFAPDDLPKPLALGMAQRLADVASGAGGSLVRREMGSWPFDRPLSYAEVYAERDRSGLSRAEFYHRTLGTVDAAGNVLEVGDDSSL